MMDNTMETVKNSDRVYDEEKSHPRPEGFAAEVSWSYFGDLGKLSLAWVRSVRFPI